MDFDQLMQGIKTRFYMCNELSEKQADDYAWIAVNEMQRQMRQIPFKPRLVPTNPATYGEAL